MMPLASYTFELSVGGVEQSDIGTGIWQGRIKSISKDAVLITKQIPEGLHSYRIWQRPKALPDPGGVESNQQSTIAKSKKNYAFHR
jgi:hypothetical protein